MRHVHQERPIQENIKNVNEGRGHTSEGQHSDPYLTHWKPVTPFLIG